MDKIDVNVAGLDHYPIHHQIYGVVCVQYVRNTSVGQYNVTLGQHQTP